MLLVWRKARRTGVSECSPGTLLDVVVACPDGDYWRAVEAVKARYGAEIVEGGLESCSVRAVLDGTYPTLAVEVLVVPSVETAAELEADRVAEAERVAARAAA